MTMPALPLITDRLTLRLFTPGDIDAMYAYQGLDDVARYLFRPPRTREQCAEVIDRIGRGTEWAADGDVLTLAVCPRDEPGLFGEVVLKLESAHAGQAEIGWVFNPEHGGRGYATEAARALAAAAFDELGVHRLFARLDELNTGSAAVAERLGMRREAHLIDNDLDGERWSSEYVYGMLAPELKR